MNSEVYFATKNGDVKALEKLYRQNPLHLREATLHGNTALHIAAREGHVEAVRWIRGHVSSCICVARNADLNTPLHEAAKGGSAEIIRILLDYQKCAAYKTNQFGETSLLIACEKGHVEASKLLLDATPLHLILRSRVDRQTCFHVTAYEGHLEFVRSILGKRSYFNILRFLTVMADVHGATSLHSAVHGGHLEIVRTMLDSNAPSGPWWCKKWCDRRSLMTKKDIIGRCAVHVAAIKGRCDIVEVFMSKMPDCTEIRSADFKTALHFAVEHNQYQVVEKILAAKRKPGEAAKLVSCDRDIAGNTVLHLAARSGVDLQLVEYLLSFPDENINPVNGDGESPKDLAEAAASQDKPNSAKIAELLEDAGASRCFIRRSKEKESKSGNDSNVMDVDTLVASLVAGITFGAVFAVPDILKEENGGANVALRTLFKVFLFSDSLALFASLTVVMAWLFRERLQAKLVVDRSLLANLSMLSLGISIIATALAFLSGMILITVPSHLEKLKDKEPEHFREYHWLLAVEMLTAFSVPSLALALMGVMWLAEYYFKATVEYQARLRKQLKQVLVYIVPSFAVVLGVIVWYGVW